MKTKEVESFKGVDISGLRMPIVCVYQRPKDYPTKCVGRIFDLTAPTNIVIVRNSVEEIRKDIKAAFPQMYPFAKHESDPDIIVESWL